MWSSELFVTFPVLEFSFFQILKVLAARVLYVSLYKSRVSVLLVTVYWQYNRVKSCSVLQIWAEADILVVLPLLVNNISVICKSELPNTSIFNNGHPTY